MSKQITVENISKFNSYGSTSGVDQYYRIKVIGAGEFTLTQSFGAGIPDQPYKCSYYFGESSFFTPSDIKKIKRKIARLEGGRFKEAIKSFDVNKFMNNDNLVREIILTIKTMSYRGYMPISTLVNKIHESHKIKSINKVELMRFALKNKREICRAMSNKVLTNELRMKRSYNGDFDTEIKNNRIERSLIKSKKASLK